MLGKKKEVLEKWFSYLNKHQNRLKVFVKQISGPHLRVSGALNVGKGLKRCISNSDADAAGLGNPL